MSFRFGADGTGDSRVSRSGGAPDPQAAGGWTLCGWWYLSADRNDFSTMFRSHAASGSTTRLTLATKTDGTTPAVFTPGNTAGVAGVDPFTVGSWLFIAVVQSGTTATIYTCTPGGTMHSASGTSSGGSAPDGYSIGGRSSSDASEWFNGRGRCVRQWATTLTPTELAAERDSLAAAVKAGSYVDHPLATGADLSDISGNSRTLTAGTAAGTTEADPPIGTSVADTSASLRTYGQPETPRVGIARQDAAGVSRATALPETAAIGIAQPDPVGYARVAALPESVSTGQATTDVAAALRVAALPERPTGNLVLLDVIGHLRVSALPEILSVGISPPDRAGALQVAPLPEVLAQAGLVADVVGVLRVACLPDTATGTAPAVPRDITVTATVLPSRYRAALLPSRWTAQEAR
ncbi:LamG-like jellyroll fold domain-containing protein [Amycolatopsis sp. NPDC051372]|uniref:LamG-like jellyroll fold domain-containing protein n=1 Tax=Amycolatopsis sp. NPDC051372 TaxID=3155669 RepID=UPI00341F287E